MKTSYLRKCQNQENMIKNKIEKKLIINGKTKADSFIKQHDQNRIMIMMRSKKDNGM